MGRPRKHNKHLPQSMFLRRGAYYFVKGGKWIPLGREYGKALTEYAGYMGSTTDINTVKDAVWSYIEHKRAKLAVSTIENYERSAAHLVARLGTVSLQDVTSAMVYQFITLGGNVQANRDKALLSAAFTHARNTGAFSGVDPTKGLQYRNEEKARDRYVEDDELDALIEAASPKLGCITRFIELTGMRQSDALRVKPGDLDDTGFTYKNTKSKKRQGLVWSAELREVVNDANRLWPRVGKEWLFESHPKGKHKKRGPGAYTPSGLRSLWRKARSDAAKVDPRVADVRLHDIRAKASSDRETDEEAQALLGHSDAKVTRRHYRRKVQRQKPTR